MLLVALAVYDLVAVLAPGGPLKLLVELASSRNEELPALIYEARPTVARAGPRGGGGGTSLGLLVAGVAAGEPSSSAIELQAVSRDNVDRSGSGNVNLNENVNENRNYGGHEYSAVAMGGFGGERSQGGRDDEEERSPLVGNSHGGREGEVVDEEMIGLENEGNGMTRRGGGDGAVEIADRGVKLGLGDFVFYSVLVGRAAMYDLMTVYACYLAIISGLGCTLILLSVCRQALPALPISIALGVLFYFLTRLLMEPFIVGTATNLMMF